MPPLHPFNRPQRATQSELEFYNQNHFDLQSPLQELPAKHDAIHPGDIVLTQMSGNDGYYAGSYAVVAYDQNLQPKLVSPLFHSKETINGWFAADVDDDGDQDVFLRTVNGIQVMHNRGVQQLIQNLVAETEQQDPRFYDFSHVEAVALLSLEEGAARLCQLADRAQLGNHASRYAISALRQFNSPECAEWQPDQETKEAFDALIAMANNSVVRTYCDSLPDSIRNFFSLVYPNSPSGREMIQAIWEQYRGRDWFDRIFRGYDLSAALSNEQLLQSYVLEGATVQGYLANGLSNVSDILVKRGLSETEQLQLLAWMQAEGMLQGKSDVSARAKSILVAQESLTPTAMREAEKLFGSVAEDVKTHVAAVLLSKGDPKGMAESYARQLLATSSFSNDKYHAGLKLLSQSGHLQKSDFADIALHLSNNQTIDERLHRKIFAKFTAEQRDSMVPLLMQHCLKPNAAGAKTAVAVLHGWEVPVLSHLSGQLYRLAKETVDDNVKIKVLSYVRDSDPRLAVADDFLKPEFILANLNSRNTNLHWRQLEVLEKHWPLERELPEPVAERMADLMVTERDLRIDESVVGGVLRFYRDPNMRQALANVADSNDFPFNLSRQELAETILSIPTEAALPASTRSMLAGYLGGSREVPADLAQINTVEELQNYLFSRDTLDPMVRVPGRNLFAELGDVNWQNEKNSNALLTSIGDPSSFFPSFKSYIKDDEDKVRNIAEQVSDNIYATLKNIPYYQLTNRDAVIGALALVGFLEDREKAAALVWSVLDEIDSPSEWEAAVDSLNRLDVPPRSANDLQKLMTANGQFHLKYPDDTRTIKMTRTMVRRWLQAESS